MSREVAAAPSSARSRKISKQVSQIENPMAMSAQAAVLRYAQVVATVPCLFRLGDAALDGKGPGLSPGDDGVMYLPADHPMKIVCSSKFVTIQSLGADGTFFICPMGSV